MENNDFSSDDFDKLLDDFIANQLKDSEDVLFEAQETTKPTSSSQTDAHKKTPIEPEISVVNEEKNYDYFDFMKDFSKEATSLAQEEFRLYEAITNLMKSSIDCAKEANEDIGFFDFDIKNIIPRFSPRRIKNISNTITACWSLLLRSQTDELSKLVSNPSDEQILSFAEQVSNKNLMMALISYVESLIEIDSCEIAYNMRKVKYKKLKIEKKIYEEEKKRKEKL